MLKRLSLFLFLPTFIHCTAAASFHDNPEQDPLSDPQVGTHASDSMQRLGDGPRLEMEMQIGAVIEEDDPAKLWGTDWPYSGISTFAHLDHVKCLVETDVKYDVAIIGAPFDNAVSYRPGARFGPRAIRAASSRQSRARSYNPRAHINPYTTPLRVIDCGDIPINPFSNALALVQMTSAFKSLLSRAPHTPSSSHITAPHPRLLTLGGDHSIALPTLRALRATYGQQLSVVHFDAHLDTWNPAKYPSAWPDPAGQTEFNHGSMLWQASNEGLLRNGSLVHAGLRTRLSGLDDWADDDRQGWVRVAAEDIDEMGAKGVAKLIVERVGTERPVYLSVDIDVLDPGVAPGTGTPEAGGWTARELIGVLRAVEELNVVAADVVEVSPAYDGKGEQTGTVAAQLAFELLTTMVKRELRERGVDDEEREV